MNDRVKAALAGLKAADRRTVLLLAAVAAATAFAFWNGLGNLLKRWSEQQELSHGYFLPAIAAWLIWERREAISANLDRPALLGVAGVAVAAVILILSEMTVTSLMVFQHLALVFLLASMAFALGGRGVFIVTLLPIAYLLFMVPPPYWVITVLSWKFQFWSSALGVFFIELFGVPVYLSGNVIDLGDYKLLVAEACSGLRYLFPFLSLGFLAAYLFRAPLWQRAAVFLSTIPITVFMNSFRIAVTGVLVDQYGIAHAEGFLHLFEGWVVFLFCMILLFAFIAGLARLSGRKDFSALLTPPEIGARKKSGEWRRDLFARNAIAALAILVAAGGVVHFTANDALKTPLRKDLDLLLSEFSDWKTERQEIDKATLEVLGADDFVVADMTSPQGELFNLYVAYLNMQRDGHSWHSPRQCIPGGGWKIISHDVLPTERADGRPYYFNRIVIENRGQRQLIYYWYDQRGRKIANEFVMKIALIVDAVRLRRTDGALIRLMTPISRDEPAGAADERLKDLMETLEPLLPDYAPPADAPLS